MIVLVGVEGIRRLLGDSFGSRHVMVRCSRLCGGRADNNIGTQTFQVPDLLGRRFLSQNKDAFIPANRCHERQTDTGIARGCLDYRAARLKHAFALGPVDHRDADAILDGIARIQALHLGIDLGLYLVLLGDVIDTNQRRLADQPENVVV